LHAAAPHLLLLLCHPFTPPHPPHTQSTWNKGETIHSAIEPAPDAIRSLLKKFGFRLYEVIDARAITARFHPHAKTWYAASPHVSPYFGYIAAEKVGV
jgi:hypothetical protein